jgi:hypothetical protein
MALRREPKKKKVLICMSIQMMGIIFYLYTLVLSVAFGLFREIQITNTINFREIWDSNPVSVDDQYAAGFFWIV